MNDKLQGYAQLQSCYMISLAPCNRKKEHIIHLLMLGICYVPTTRSALCVKRLSINVKCLTFVGACEKSVDWHNLLTPFDWQMK